MVLPGWIAAALAFFSLTAATPQLPPDPVPALQPAPGEKLFNVPMVFWRVETNSFNDVDLIFALEDPNVREQGLALCRHRWNGRRKDAPENWVRCPSRNFEFKFASGYKFVSEGDLRQEVKVDVRYTADNKTATEKPKQMIGQFWVLKELSQCGDDKEVASPDCAPAAGTPSGPSCETRVRARRCAMELTQELRLVMKPVA